MVDINLFKQVMRRFATGVMVLTVPDGTTGAHSGMHAATVNAVTSVSLNPLLMLVCIEKNAQSHGLLHAAGVFALNILRDDQRELGERFAYDREARGRPADFVKGAVGQTGALLFQDALAFLECRVTAEHPGGDHTIFIGEVVNAQIEQANSGPLIYYGGKFANLPRK